jgi:hypothetical protein
MAKPTADVTAGARLPEPRIEALATAIGNAAELLHIEVEELAGMGPLIADHLARGPVQPGQALQAGATQHRVDG